MEMEAEYKQNPTEIVSYAVIEVGNTMKKRKLQAEQLGMPTPKHKCWDINFPSAEPVSMSDEFPVQQHITKGGIDAAVLNNVSGPGSGKGSSSFSGDYYDSAMSFYREAESNPSYAKSSHDKPSSSSGNVDIVKDSGSSFDSVSAMEENYGEADLEFVNMEVHQSVQNHEKPLLEFGGEESYICSEYGEHFIEECTDKEVEDIIKSSSLNSHSYVLSSGRWSVTQEAQSGSSRKPTIDQEFEQYFSSLML